MLSRMLRELAEGRNFAAFTTLRPDGHPATQVMWVDCDDECLLINTETLRRKYRNARNDPRVTVMIWDAADPYRYAEACRASPVRCDTGP
jgi:PPOX class probable F420-dependent enzyme